MLKDLIAAIEHELGKKAIIELLPEQPGDVPQTYANINKAKADLGYAPSTPLEDGLRSFHHWYRQMPRVAD